MIIEHSTVIRAYNLLRDRQAFDFVALATMFGLKTTIENTNLAKHLSNTFATPTVHV